MKLLLFLILVFVLIPTIVLASTGLIPGLSSIIGTDKPRDLGIKYTIQNLDSAQLKLRQNLLNAKADPEKKFEMTAGTPIDIALTSEEYSAHVERLHPLSDVQIKLNGTNFEMSARIDKSRIPEFARVWNLTNASDEEILQAIDKYLPANPVFYLAGTGTVENNNLELKLTKAELGRLPFPIKQAEEWAELYTETLLNKIDGFKVEKAYITSGQLQYKGTSVAEIPKY